MSIHPNWHEGLLRPLMHEIQTAWQRVRSPSFCPVNLGDLDAIRRQRMRCPRLRHAAVVYRTPVIHTRHRKMQQLDWLKGDGEERCCWWEVHRHHACDQGKCRPFYTVVECDEHIGDAAIECGRHHSLSLAIREADAWDHYYRHLFDQMDRQP